MASHLRAQYHTMQQKGYSAGISDVEGELLYTLIRETKPAIVFEISPDAGWSTNYILAALTSNNHGLLHTFEVRDKTRGKPTEHVIRENQHHLWDKQRLTVHIGDAREIVTQVSEPINFLFIDSCHEDWFADWYATTLFPRVKGLAMIEDIAFSDQLEPSSEADYMWNWISTQQTPVTLVGSLENRLESTPLRAGFAQRSPRRGNSVIFRLPSLQTGELPQLAPSLEGWIERAEQEIANGNSEPVDQLLNQASIALLNQSSRANRHRAMLRVGLCYARIGEVTEARRCFERALGLAMEEDSLERCKKGLPELLESFVRYRQWSLAVKTGALMLSESRARSAVIKTGWKLARRLVRSLAQGAR